MKKNTWPKHLPPPQPCPFCATDDSTPHKLSGWFGTWWLACHGACGLRSATRETMHAAVEAWNALLFAPRHASEPRPDDSCPACGGASRVAGRDAGPQRVECTGTQERRGCGMFGPTESTEGAARLAWRQLRASEP